MEIYAEITKKIQYQLDNDGCSLRFPVGVNVERQGRGLYIECEEYMIDMVEDLLDSSGIPYQEMDEREDDDDGHEEHDGHENRSVW